MHKTSDFIAELVRAANRVDRLPDATLANLLDSSYETIRNMREAIGLPSYGQRQDVAIDMMTMSSAVPALAASEIAAGLLEAAAEIRSLHIATCEQKPVPYAEQHPLARHEPLSRLPTLRCKSGDSTLEASP